MMKITQKDIEYMVNESIKKILSEGKFVIDNFDKAEKMLDISSPDDFHFIQITKRFKDNKDDDRKIGNYHGGSWYLDTFRVHNSDELNALKPKIIQICNANNARAYMTINKRSEKETDSYIKIYRKQFKSTDPRYIHASEIVPGQAKDGPNWKGVRKRVLIDIDVPKTATDDRGLNIWDTVHFLIKNFGITPIDEYETASGGLHIILPDKEDSQFIKMKQIFKNFDNGIDKGRLATVHPNVDAKMILYSNVNTAGY